MPKRDKTADDLAASPDAGTITIEADSVEEAMQRLATEVGETAEILDARKVHRGGIGGFFAKERVQLTARSGEDSVENTAERSESPGTEAAGLAGVLDRMTRDAEAQETQFATMLRRELGADSRDLGLDTFLEAVGWDDRTSAAEAEKAHLAVDEITTAMIQPAPVNAEAEAEVAVEAALEPVAGEDEAAAAVVPQVESPTPPPIVVQRVSLAPEVTPRTPTEELPATFTPLEPRTGIVANYPGPSLMTHSAVADSATTALAVSETPDWRRTDSGIARQGMGPISWSTMDLVRHGIPTELVAAVADIDVNDDIAWIMGLAAAVAPYCGPLPELDTVVVGPNAEDIAEALNVTLVEPGQTAPYEGSFASVITSQPEDRDWLEFVRGNRRLHYAIGSDQSWRRLLLDVPAVVSWVGEATLVDALYLAVAFDCTLGYGVLPGSGGTLTRTYPVDIALAIRSMMARS